MAVLRYQMLYPDCMFRAVIDSKNVAPPEDKWAEGALCRDIKGELFIINRKAGEGKYGLCMIEPPTLGLASCFLDGGKRDIFEGDIIEITVFEPLPEAEEEPPEEEPAPGLFDFSGFIEEDFGKKQEEEPPEEEEEREIFEEPPEGAEILLDLRGVVFMSGGVFYMQIHDDENNALGAVPLYTYFFWDMLPAPNTAVKVLGNLYDDEELYEEVLALKHYPESAETFMQENMAMI